MIGGQFSRAEDVIIKSGPEVQSWRYLHPIWTDAGRDVRRRSRKMNLLDRFNFASMLI